MQKQESSLAKWPGANSKPTRVGRMPTLSRFLMRVTTACGELSCSLDSMEKCVRNTAGAAVVIAFGYLCAKFTWLVVAGVTLPINDEMTESSRPTISSSRSTENYAIFSTFDPFSRRSVTTETSLVTAAPETNLDLKLFGLRFGGEAGVGSAIIRTPDKRQASYAIGDEVTPGVVLKEVFANRAIISRDGVQESLSLKPEGDGGSSFTQLSDSTSISRVSAPGALDASSSSSVLFSQLNLRPRLQSGRISGFYIDPEGANPDLLKSAGLRAADILLSVNDVRLVSVERITDVLEELKNEVSFDAVIERDGSPMTITLERPAEVR